MDYFRNALACVLLLALPACTGTLGGGPAGLGEGHGDDHGTTLDGAEEVLAAVDDAGRSPIYEADEQFVWLSLTWDAPDDARLELRTSQDGSTWSDWQRPAVDYQDAEIHNGTVRVEGGEGLFYQYRIDLQAPQVRFLSIEPQLTPYVSSEELEAMPVLEQDEPDAPLTEDEELGTATEALSARRRFRTRPRRAWGARPPRCKSRMNPYRATIHHSVTPTNDPYTPQRRLRAIQAYHMRNPRNCDILYNYAISRDGRVWRLRGARRRGGHTYNNNRGNIGIVFLGNYEISRPRRVQLRAAAHLLKRLNRRFPRIRLNRKKVRGHRQYGAYGGGTACPGKRLYWKIRRILRIARNL